MNDSASNTRIPLGKLGWVVVALVLAAPLLFFALVTPTERPLAPAPEVAAPPPSPLAAVGLRNNRDWDALPALFALAAPKAHWRNNRTRFAYWNPGTQSHSYFFEARRTDAGVRFREIPEPTDPGYEWDPAAAPEDPLRLYLPIRPRPEDPVRPLESQPGTRSDPRK